MLNPSSELLNLHLILAKRLRSDELLNLVVTFFNSRIGLVLSFFSQ